MSIAVCPGSFDPITKGHIDVAIRARTMFDEVIIAISTNAKKSYMFSVEERLELASECVADLDGIRVEISDGLIADYAKNVGASAIVKGLRGAADYDGEQAMALLNRHLTGVETVFVLGDPNLSHIASSFVKEIASYGGKIEDLVPANVAVAIRKKVGA